MQKKQAVVIHSGGMDSSLCLALAIKEFGSEDVLSLSFSYQQKHGNEVVQAEKICRDWNVTHVNMKIDYLSQITSNALLNHDLPTENSAGTLPNTLVVGRNGLMARLGAIYAHQIEAHTLYMGIIGIEEANSGYRDCSRSYMDLKEQILRIDLADPDFEIRTPLVHMKKEETLELAYQMGILNYLLRETISCYEGVQYQGCQKCPACILRNAGIKKFLQKHPDFQLPYYTNSRNWY